MAAQDEVLERVLGVFITLGSIGHCLNFIGGPIYNVIYLADDKFHIDSPLFEISDEIVIALLRCYLLGPEVFGPRAGAHTDDVDKDQVEIID